jgi:hypothetical protein
MSESAKEKPEAKMTLLERLQAINRELSAELAYYKEHGEFPG